MRTPESTPYEFELHPNRFNSLVECDIICRLHFTFQWFNQDMFPPTYNTDPGMDFVQNLQSSLM